MNKEPTKLQDLIQADDEETALLDPLHSDAEKLRTWMQENIGGLQNSRTTASYALEFLKTQHRNLIGYQDERLRVVSGLSALEHRIAETAIAVRIYQTTPVPTGANRQEWWDEYQRIFHIRTEAEDALIKFKSEEKRW